MKKPIPLFLLLMCMSFSANADIWKWTDANGDVHFVTSKKAIYTWVDSYGMVQYADKPGHEDAVSVDLVWHSTGDEIKNATADAAPKASSNWFNPNETDAERFEREQAEQYYCKRAQAIYDSYVSAPRLYETDENGERVYLSEEQTAAKIAETKATVDQVCR